MTIGDILRSGFLSGSVGNNRENLNDDVMRVKSKLSEHKMFDFSNSPEPHGYVTREMDQGIKEFQKAKGLKVDGFLLPDGETERALFKEKKSDCQNLETAYINAEARYYILKQKLKRAEDRKFELENELIYASEKFGEVSENIKKEDKDKVIAKSKGAVTGGAVGALIGSRGGTGASMALAQVGMGVGSNTGRIIEELGDAIDSASETDFTLDSKKLKVMEDVQKVQNKISSQQVVINSLFSELDIARQKMENAKAAWAACKGER